MTLDDKEPAFEAAIEVGQKLSSTAKSVGRAASKAKESLMDTAHEAQERAAEMGEAAIEQGTELVASLTDAGSRNLRIAGTTAKDFVRRNPELLIAGAAMVGLGVLAWLRSGSVQRMQETAMGAVLPKPRTSSQRIQGAKSSAKTKATRKSAS